MQGENSTVIKRFILRKPLVSIIMPTYNRGHCLPNAIESILSQTYPYFEFIIINDGSSDKTDAILNAYKKKDPRIKILRNDSNMGIVTSLNKALKIAKGKYIARMDDDDISLPTRIEKQVQYMDIHPDITVLGTAIQLPNSNEIKRLSSSSEESAILSLFQVPVYHPTTLIRHSFLKHHKLNYAPQYDAAEDTAFWYNIIEKGGKITNLSEPLVIQDIFSKKNYDGGKQAHSFNQFIDYTLTPLFKEKVHLFRYQLSNQQFCIITKEIEKTNYKNLYHKPAMDSIYKKYCPNGI